MGQVTAVYGTIVGPRSERLQTLNNGVIEVLPSRDDWPFLTREMFNINSTKWPYEYRQKLIIFGGTFKSVEWQWDEWLVKFEELLKNLYWEETFLHLRPLEATVGHHDYYYQAEDTFERFYRNEPPLTVATWQFDGGPRKFQF